MATAYEVTLEKIIQAFHLKVLAARPSLRMAFYPQFGCKPSGSAAGWLF